MSSRNWISGAAEQRAMAGTAVGAGTGAIAGAIGGNAALGAGIGAGVGLLGGLAVDQHRRDEDRAFQRGYDTRARQ